YLNVSACIIPDSAVLTLREEKPSADSCGDPFLDKHIDGLLPVGCGAEPVFNFSWEKEIELYGSGDDGETMETTIIPTRSLLSTAAHHRTTRSPPAVEVGIVSVTPNRSAPRLPPRFTPSPESRHASFQKLLRFHLNTFNQRLSMLESNTLDMKESIHSMGDQQSQLGTQLKELLTLQSAWEKNKKISELEKSYIDMDSRLSRLEGRLEILIDGFTALAQEMNKMKRTRHVSRSPQERRVPPSLTTVLELPLYSTPRPPVRIIPTEAPFTSRATVPKSIPTPGLPVNKSTSVRQRVRKLKPSPTDAPVKNTVTRSSRSQVSTRSAKLKTPLTKPRNTSKSTSTITKRPEGRRSSVTAKRVPQPNQTKLKQEAITKFQLEPPSHKPKPDQSGKKDSSKNNGHDKAFRSDAPVSEEVQEGEKTSEGDSKKLSKAHKDNSYKLVSNGTKTSSKNTLTTIKPTKATTAKKKSNTTVKTTTPARIKPTTAKKSKTTVKRMTPAKIKATTAKKKSKTTVKTTTTAKTKVTIAKKSNAVVKRTTPAKLKATTAKRSSITVKKKSAPPKTKATTAKEVTKKPQQKRKKTNSHAGVLDLLQLLQGNYKSAKHQKHQDGSLHVVLGRLAIPIRIIPDD
ncbi:uncharacterized protein LOC144464165, partial [Epinephelus lanceolatus]